MKKFYRSDGFAGQTKQAQRYSQVAGYQTMFGAQFATTDGA